MIRCFIQVANGQAINHPVVVSNFKEVFPDYDADNGPLPDGWARFDRPEPPVLGPYDLSSSSVYEQVDGVWTDVWTVVSMTEEEKVNQQNEVKTWWAENGFASWTFDEELCMFVPPVPRPPSGLYVWNEDLLDWVEVADA
jgi:hypothetical protein